MIEFKEETATARESGEGDPRIPDVLGEIFIKIASHLSYKSNFINYAFRDDMIADGVENCIQYIHNFDPAKSKNPFAYFTQIIYYAFLRRIQKEKKQLYVRYKSLEISQMDSFSKEDHATVSSLGITKLYDNMSEFIESYEDSMEKKKQIKSKQRKTTKKKKKKQTTSNNILQFASNLTEEEKL
jgi:DNA-directed RNA polymerase specialized sigma24 family protein